MADEAHWALLDADGRVVAQVITDGAPPSDDGSNPDGLTEIAVARQGDLRIEELAEGSWVPLLDTLRAEQERKVDAEAEAFRQNFITPGSGQALTYQRKEAEARGWASDGDPATAPFLAAEASATGVSIDDVAAEVIAAADQWTQIGALIEGRRMGAKAAIADADTLAAIEAAGDIEWAELLP